MGMNSGARKAIVICGKLAGSSHPAPTALMVSDWDATSFKPPPSVTSLKPSRTPPSSTMRGEQPLLTFLSFRKVLRSVDEKGKKFARLRANKKFLDRYRCVVPFFNGFEHKGTNEPPADEGDDPPPPGQVLASGEAVPDGVDMRMEHVEDPVVAGMHYWRKGDPSPRYAVQQSVLLVAMELWSWDEKFFYVC